MMAKVLRVAIFVAFIFSTRTAFAACHAVTASGAGSMNGTNWSNAYARIPGALTRGDIYYFADGIYGAYTFQQADSGTSVITFKKAQSYDFGRASDGCSNDISAGWNASTMGSGQATFSSSGTALTINTDYFTMNGNGTSTAIGCGGAPGSTVTASPPTPSDCGFLIQGLGGTTSGALNEIGMGSSTHQTLMYIELLSSGTNNINGSGGLDIFRGQGFFTLTHSYLHNSGCVYIQDVGSNSLIDHSYFWGTEVYGALGSQACHGQAEFEAGGTNNGVRSNNVWRDIVGTAVWTFALGTGTNNNWQFNNQIVFYSNPTASWVSSAGFGPLANGILACINTGVFCTNFTLNQNTIVNTMGSFAGGGILSENAGGSYTLKNNLWYNNANAVGFSGSGVTQDHNSFLNSTTSCLSGTANVCDNSAPNPFLNWPAGNFTLASDNADWNNRLSLSPPYNRDAAGNAFTTDLGAYQFLGSKAQAPQPPTGLVSTVQ